MSLSKVKSYNSRLLPESQVSRSMRERVMRAFKIPKLERADKKGIGAHFEFFLKAGRTKASSLRGSSFKILIEKPNCSYWVFLLN